MPGQGIVPGIITGEPQQKVVVGSTFANGVTVTGLQTETGTYPTAGHASSTGCPLHTGPQILKPLFVSAAPNKHNSERLSSFFPYYSFHFFISKLKAQIQCLGAS